MSRERERERESGVRAWIYDARQPQGHPAQKGGGGRAFRPSEWAKASKMPTKMIYDCCTAYNGMREADHRELETATREKGGSLLCNANDPCL